MVLEQTEKNRRILVIDDNEAIHDDFRKILEVDDAPDDFDEDEALIFGETESDENVLQFKVDSAFQGKDGYELVRQAARENRPYSLAFVDMRMPPGWDGVETIEKLWEADPDLQVVICTAYSDYSWGEIIERLGKSDRLLILKKPFDTSEVCQLASALTEKWNLCQETRNHQDYLEATVADRTASLKEIMERLKESKLFLQSTLDALSAQIGILDEDGTILSVNAAWTDDSTSNPLAGPQLPVGSNFLLGRDDAAELPSGAADLAIGIRDVISGAEDEFLLEYTASDDDGQTRHYMSHVTRFLASSTTRVVLAHKDITHVKNLQSQLSQAQKLESIGQLAAGVAHEINTPIQYIGDNTRFLQDAFGDLMEVMNEVGEFLKSEAAQETPCEQLALIREKAETADLEYLKEEVPGAIEQSLSGIDRVAKIVRAMKEFSHPGQQGKTQVDLNRAIESTITVARNEWKYVAQMVTEFDESLPPVTCLPGELNQVVLNLIVNATHAIADVVGDGSQGQGTITVSTKQVGDLVEIRITDTGTGIPEHAQAKIFDPFFTTKEVGKGTGQGLAIAYAVIVDQHDGQLSFETTAGEGTTFVIKLPLEPKKVEEPVPC